MLSIIALWLSHPGGGNALKWPYRKLVGIGVSNFDPQLGPFLFGDYDGITCDFQIDDSNAFE